jgi:hypothetical protein
MSICVSSKLGDPRDQAHDGSAGQSAARNVPAKESARREASACPAIAPDKTMFDVSSLGNLAIVVPSAASS